MKVIVALIICLKSSIALAQLEVHQIYDKLNDAVVEIVTTEKVQTNSKYIAYSEGIGSGVVVSNEGYVLTAAHVVQTANNIKVKFNNGEEILAKVLRLSKVADVALVKLQWLPKELVVAPLGNSDTVKIGEKVIVIGAPYGLSHSLSVGHISGKHTESNKTSGFVNAEFFQTDASINHGNSGGPMFNNRGEVIGIVSSILTESGGFDGIGFAATSNVSKKLVLNENSFYTGLDGYLLNGYLCKSLNVPQSSGLLIQKIVPLSPADISGLKGGFISSIIENEEIILGGDIILEVEGQPITSIESFEKILPKIKPLVKQNKPIRLKILREGSIQEILFEFR